MVSLQEYKIAYKGLKNGRHIFDFDIASSFFSHFETSKVKEGNFKVTVDMDKKDTMMVLDFDIRGYHSAACDRCTAGIDVDVNGEDQVIIKVTEDETAVDTDEVIYLNPKDTHLDLTEILYELIHVLIPIASLRDCEAEDYVYCDHDALDILENPAEDEEEIDEPKENPLWKGLKDIEL